MVTGGLLIGTPTDRQQLHFEGEPMKLLEDYSVGEGSTLELTLKKPQSE